MRSIKLAALGCGVGLMLASGLWAQQTRPDGQPDAARHNRTPGQAEQVCLASKLIGTSVKAQQEQCGTIKDLVIGANGDVRYLAIHAQQPGQAEPRSTRREQAAEQRTERQSGFATGGQGQLILVPWEIAQFPSGAQAGQQQSVMLQIENARLSQAPKFTEQQLTQQRGQAQWMAQVDQFFNAGQRRGVARPQLEPEDREQPQSQERRSTPDQDN